MKTLKKHKTKQKKQTKNKKTTKKAKQKMYFHWSLPVFTVVMVISVWTRYNYGDYRQRLSLNINISTKYVYVRKYTHTTSMKKPRKLCFENVNILSIICRRKEHIFKKHRFKGLLRRCKDLRICWDNHNMLSLVWKKKKRF